MTFGLKAGLLYNNLQEIGSNSPGSIDACFTQCVASWLMRKDNVDEKGKPTLLKLADIVKETGDKAVAEEITETIKKKDEKSK